MAPRRRRKKLPADPLEATIDSLSHDGRGVTHIGDRATFIHGTLPGERVLFRYSAKRRKHDEGILLEIISASPERVEPKCPHFGICGGCSLQHQASADQIAAKAQALLDALQDIGNIAPAEVLPPLANDSPWGYRRKARLGAKFVLKKDKLLLGFRERGSSFVADLSQCHVLHPKVGMSLHLLRELVDSLDIKERVPQVEVAMDDSQCVLIFRVLEQPSDTDREKLHRFGLQHDFPVYLQPGGAETVQALTSPVRLQYRLAEFDLQMEFLPTDFTQVNSEINQKMIARAVELLAPARDDRILDLFCGIGNFTLPLARFAGTVTGVEGDASLVERARENAVNNSIGNVDFYTTNLYDNVDQEPWLKGNFNKVLLDPPRSGALEILEQVVKLGAGRILYISCYPGTLARDAGELVNRYGYKLLSAGVMDMFPHTAHVESIALFEKK